MARPPKRCGGCPLRGQRAADVCAGCEMYSLPAYRAVFADASLKDDKALRPKIDEQISRFFPRLPVIFKYQLQEGIAGLVGYHRVMVLGQAWPQPGRRKTRLDLAQAVYDCGELWTKVTGKDWRSPFAGKLYGNRDAWLKQHPPIKLARILVEVTTGKPHPQSLDKAFRRAKSFFEIRHRR